LIEGLKNKLLLARADLKAEAWDALCMMVGASDFTDEDCFRELYCKLVVLKARAWEIHK